MKFPLDFKAPCGQHFIVTAAHVKEDYACLVRQFNDLTPEQQEAQISRATEEDLMAWFAEQWTWHELLIQGCKVGPWVHRGKSRYFDAARAAGVYYVHDWLCHLRGFQEDDDAKPPAVAD